MRVPEITSREDLPEDQREFYDSIIASRKRISAPYNFLLHAPDLAARTAHLIGYSLFSTDFPEDMKELAICAVARELDWSLSGRRMRITRAKREFGRKLLKSFRIVRRQRDLLNPRQRWCVMCWSFSDRRIGYRDVRGAKKAHRCSSTGRVDWNDRCLRGPCVLAQRL